MFIGGKMLGPNFCTVNLSELKKIMNYVIRFL